MLRSVKEEGARGPGVEGSPAALSCPLLRSCPLSPVPCPLLLLLLCLAPLHAAIFPDQIGEFKKEPPKTIGGPDQALYEEYGLETTEQAEYTAPPKHFTATAWRMRDSTGAMALFEARRPPGATPAKLAQLAVTTSDGVILAYGNY